MSFKGIDVGFWKKSNFYFDSKGFWQPVVRKKNIFLRKAPVLLLYTWEIWKSKVTQVEKQLLEEILSKKNRKKRANVLGVFEMKLMKQNSFQSHITIILGIVGKCWSMIIKSYAMVDIETFGMQHKKFLSQKIKIMCDHITKRLNSKITTLL